MDELVEKKLNYLRKTVEGIEKEGGRALCSGESFNSEVNFNFIKRYIKKTEETSI